MKNKCKEHNKEVKWKINLTPEQQTQLNLLCVQFAPYTKKIAGRYLKKFHLDEAIEMDDLMQQGVIGIIEAYMRHIKKHPDKINEVPSNIYLVIKQRISRWLMSQNGRKTNAVSAWLLVYRFPDQFDRIDENHMHEEEINNKVDKELLYAAWNQFLLTVKRKRTRDILTQKINYKLSSAKVGENYGVSRSNVDTLVSLYIEQFKDYLKHRGYEIEQSSTEKE